MIAVVQVRQLGKRFNQRIVLDGLDFQADAGEIVAILGVNGAGKTTFIRLLAGLSRPNSGSIELTGFHLPSQANAARQNMGVTLHQPMLFPELTAAENLRFYARLYGLSEIEPRLSKVLNWVRLEARRGDLAREFSRGMQQRLAIARAVLHSPRVLLLDEPFTGLDEDACTDLIDLLGDLAADGAAIILTSHDLSRIQPLCTRIDVLHAGQIAASRLNKNLTPDGLAKFHRSTIAGKEGA